LYSSDPLEATKKDFSLVLTTEFPQPRKSSMNMLPPYQVCISFFEENIFEFQLYPSIWILRKLHCIQLRLHSAKTETAEKSQQTKASRRGPVENQTDRLASKKCQDF
jgi:hypothetical protein